jgi:tetratricopeptide (TPR) repeat protein
LDALAPTGEKHLRGLLLNYVGVAAQVQGQVEQTIHALAESIALLSASNGDYWSAAGSRTNLAALLIFEERTEDAVQLLQESFTYFHHIGDLVSTALTLDHLAYIEVSLNHNPKAAADLCHQALTLLEQTGLPSRKAEVLSSLGVIALKGNDPQAAYVYSVAALRIALDISRTVDIITIGAWLAIALLRLDQLVTPAAHFLCTALSSPLLQADIRKALDAAMEDLPEPCRTAPRTAEVDAEFDWRQGATALLAPL